VDAPYAYVGERPSTETELLWRTKTGTDGVSRPFEDENLCYDWDRLDRNEDAVTVSVSMDGEHWQAVDELAVKLSGPAQIGMVACSCRAGSTVEARFERVSVLHSP